ncbi:hypothetical protein OC845_003084 [Tilletia horrida]|nr:hypothetical protein OC845_003084 [Tilletia horrida]
MAEPQKKKQKRRDSSSGSGSGSAAQVLDEHRLHVSGLNPASVSADDLRSRFSSFGTVTDLTNWPPTKPSQDAVGRPITYTFLTLKTTQQQLSRCLSLLNNSAWKGSKLKIGHAHQHYSAKLQKEKTLTQESGWKPPPQAELKAKLSLLPGGQPLTLQQVQSSPTPALPKLKAIPAATQEASSSDSSGEDSDDSQSDLDSNSDSETDDHPKSEEHSVEGAQQDQTGLLDVASTQDQMSEDEDDQQAKQDDEEDVTLPEDEGNQSSEIEEEKEEEEAQGQEEEEEEEEEEQDKLDAEDEEPQPQATLKPTTNASQIPLHFGGLPAASNEPSPYFSILGGLALDDMEMDEDFEFGREEDQFHQQPSMVDGEPVSSLWTNASRVTEATGGSGMSARGKLPLLFPKMEKRSGNLVLAQDDPSAPIPFHRTQSVDEIEQNWKNNRQALTQEYKRRHREAVKKHKRRIVGSRLAGGGVAIRATANQSRAM